MSIFLIAFIIITYLNIGYFYGLWRWKVNERRCYNRDWFNYILWPVQTWGENVVRESSAFPFLWRLAMRIGNRSNRKLINGPASEIVYAVMMAAAWGLTLLWTILALIAIGICFLAWELFYFFIRTITWPIRTMNRFK